MDNTKYAAQRDATAYRNPGIEGATRYHIVGRDGIAAACSNRIILMSDVAIGADEVEGWEQCKRPACAQHFKPANA